MTRKLLGYAVRSGQIGEWYNGKHGEGLDMLCPWGPKKDRVFFETMADACDYASTYSEESALRIVPVFSKPNAPKPAPVDAAERYACMQGCFMWLTDDEDDPRDSGTRAEAEALLARAGLTAIRSTWVNENSWSVTGRKSVEP